MGTNSQSGSVAIAAALQVFTVLGQHTCAALVTRGGSCGLAACQHRDDCARLTHARCMLHIQIMVESTAWGVRCAGPMIHNSSSLTRPETWP